MTTITHFKDDAFATTNPINLREVLAKYLYHWPVFLIGIILALLIAFLYLRFTPPVYNVKASLLIKDTRQDNTGGLKELNMFSDNRVVENEMEILRSKTLMQKVVQELGLNISYSLRGRISSTDIYDAKPVNIQFLELQPASAARTYKLDILDMNRYTLFDEDTKLTIEGEFGRIQKLPFGICRINKTSLWNSYIGRPVYLTYNSTESRASALLQNLSLYLINRQTTVVELNLNAGVISRGKDVLNKLVEVYNAAAIEDKNRSTENSIRFIKDRLAYISEELYEVEQNEDKFRLKFGFLDISGQAQIIQRNIQTNDEKLTELEMQLNAIEAFSKEVNNPSQKGGTPTPFGIMEPSLGPLVNELAVLKYKRDHLLETTHKSHPMVISAESEMQNTRETIMNTLNNIKSSLKRTNNLLQAKNEYDEATLRSIPANERELINIRRQKNIKENLYLLLLQRLEEAGLSSATTLADNRLIEKAYASIVPIKPDRSSIYLMALAFGFFIPLVYIFSKDALNFKVISSKDISGRTSVPVIGNVMFHENSDYIVISNNSRSVIAEQFRSLRTNLQYIFRREKGPRVTLFTSSMSGEGKSFISSNIAVSLAMADRKTVILELDLRKPKIGKYLKPKNKIGLSHYLTGNAAKEDIVQPSSVHPNLSVITSGPVPPNPAELLEHPEVDGLITWLKTEFDEILINTPPVGLVTDALILARLADVSIFVVRHGVTLKSQVLAIEQLNQENKFPNLNVIHNGIRTSGPFGYSFEDTYGYNRNGYNSYGYYDDLNHGKSKYLPATFLKFFDRF